MRSSPHVPAALLAVILVTLAPGNSEAQPLWLTQDHNKLLAFEILKPGFESQLGTGFTTLSFFFTARLPLTEKASFVGELPLAHYDPDETVFLEPQTAMGNIYLGLEQNSAGGFGEFGVRIPTMPDGKTRAQTVGVASDLDRWEAWLEDAIAIMAFGNFRSYDDVGLGTRARLGASVWIPTMGADIELWIPYTLMGFYRDREGQGEVTFGITGRAILTESDLSFDERTYHQLVFAGHLNVGQVQLGAQYKHFLDQIINEDVKYVFGFSVGLALE